MLTEMRLLNFKSFIDDSIPLSPMTLLAGVNNTGKSIFKSLSGNSIDEETG